MSDLEQEKVQSEIDGGDNSAVADSQNVATEYNGLAIVAQRNGCEDIARSLYLKVIETYVGAGYEAMRQRAQIGMDNLRAKDLTVPLSSSILCLEHSRTQRKRHGDSTSRDALCP